MTTPTAYRKHLDSLECTAMSPCAACGEEDAVPATWACDLASDLLVSACFLCGTVFEVDWDYPEGGMPRLRICHEIRTDEESLAARGGRQRLDERRRLEDMVFRDRLYAMMLRAYGKEWDESGAGRDGNALP